MVLNLREKYLKLKDEELFAILTSSNGDYVAEAVQTAKEILLERGHAIDLNTLFAKKYSEYLDEDLIQIFESKEGNEKYAVETKAIEEILTKRGFNIVEVDDKTENRESSSFIPLIVGVMLAVLNFIYAGIIYEYNMTGRGSETMLYFIKDTGILFRVILGFISLALVYYYRKKQHGSLIALWMLAGLLFGGWTLIVVGIIELLTDYPLEESEID